MAKKSVPQTPSEKQSLLFNPDLHPMQYVAKNGTLEITFDGKLNTFWLSQKQIAEMFGLTQQAISLHVQNFKKQRPEDAKTAYKESLYISPDGKQQRVEQYNHTVVIYIGYRAQVTDETIRFQRFVEEVFRQRMEDEHQRALKKAQLSRAADITGYILSGKTQSHAERRVDMKSSIKQLNAIIIELTSPKMIGAVLNREYVLLFNKVADELKIILHTKNIRDALPEMHLEYLDLSERNLIRILQSKASLTPEELMEIVDITIRPLGNNLREMCRVMGIDPVTGKSLLKAGDK